MLLFLASFAHAACPAAPAALQADVARVERAFAALDAAGVGAAGADLERIAACLDTPIAPSLAVRVHAAAGLTAFINGDTARAAEAFAAARRIDPSWLPDPALVPKGHPIHVLAARLDPVRLGVERVEEPARGALYFDGERGDRPKGTPTVAQWVVRDTVVSGAYVWPDAPLPAYDAVEQKRSRRGLATWLVVGGTAAAASATCVYVASRARDAWEDAETGKEVQARYNENHALLGAGATFGVLAVVGGVGVIASAAF